MAKKAQVAEKMAEETQPAEGGKIKCAFCDGAGLDPFGALSPLSKCQVCHGRGKVTVPIPNMKCAFCGGTGIYPDKRLTCTVCRGKGVVAAVKAPKTCPACTGTGESRSTKGLPCTMCKGRGVI